MMRQQCVSLQPVDASSCSQDDYGSDHGDDDQGRGDWGLGGDDDHCHGDSCTVCGKGEVGYLL